MIRILKRLPEHMKRYYGTLRGFKQAKRQKSRAADRALRELFTGCAFTPATLELNQIRILMIEVRRKLSVRAWGR